MLKYVFLIISAGAWLGAWSDFPSFLSLADHMPGACPFYTIGAFPLCGTTRLGTVQNSSARFAFPLQFSTALEWAGLFTCRYSCAASTAVTPEKLLNSASLHHALAGSAPWLSTRGTSVLLQQTTKQTFFGC